MALPRKVRSNGQRTHTREAVSPARPSVNDDSVNAELRAWGQHLELMVEVSSVLTADPGREAIHEQLLSGLRGTTGLANAAIYRLYPEERVLCSVTGTGAARPEAVQTLPLDGTGLVELAARRKEAIYVSDVTAAPPGLCANPETRSEYAVPLLMGPRLLGVLSVASPE
ncbi:MAG: GAF domain-containing protein, partial [Acidobacteria bacterium]|nr:GAF domain-containing protein [Acidobacteriota bacterium]